MNLASFFGENKSACRGGMCAGDPECPDKYCEGYPLGVEAALPNTYRPAPGYPPVTQQTPEDSEPFDWQLIVVWIGVAVAMGAVLALSSWPQMVAWLSF
jgi:hypothetical protein